MNRIHPRIWLWVIMALILAAAIGPALLVPPPSPSTLSPSLPTVPAETTLAPATDGSGESHQRQALPLSPAESIRPAPSTNPASPATSAAPSPAADGLPSALSAAQPAPATDVLAVQLAVLGPDRTRIWGPGTLSLPPEGRWGSSVLATLEAAQLAYQLAPGSRAFVTAIGGYANRGSSGWMYQVNGQVPMQGADQLQLQAGDRVIWWYSSRLSEDRPDWASLTGSRNP